ncbi:uncharacterized protein M6B38_402045 [Iris pallida]|uniref:Choline transporter-like protein n=1 Tax=Iris pallida TaxID=29817 RepID=A0AAX6FT11_IRIPA|nr:uncharacterized protein M6B38_402045 [Iris pallida]
MEESEPLLLPAPSDNDSSSNYAQISYTHSPRPLRDLPFLVLFLLLSLSTFALGIFSIVRHNPNHSSSSFTYDFNSSSCISTHLSTNYSFLKSANLNKNLIWTLVTTALLSVPIAFLLLSLLRRFAAQLVYATLPFLVLIPLSLDAYWFVACTISPSCSRSFPLPYRVLLLVFLLVLLALLLWILLANWHRVRLSVHILRVSAAALADNPPLLAVLPALALGLLLYLGPVIVFLVYARLNGRVVPKHKGSDGEYYCEWKEERWVPAYYALAVIVMIWSSAAMVEAQVYVISGTVAQWYFAMEGTKPSRSVRTSLRNAFGPSFGTVCFSGMLVGAIRVVRAIVDSTKREENAGGFVNLILRCCANFFLSAFDFVNKFTINFAAITGEAYCSSAKMTYELLKRNLLSAVFVETVSTRILVGIIFVISALYAVAVCAILKAVSALGSEIYLVAAIAWLLLFVVLAYFVHVLDNVIDTIYVCYAIDRDKGEVCKQEVHEIYSMLPISRNHSPPLSDRTPVIV